MYGYMYGYVRFCTVYVRFVYGFVRFVYGFVRFCTVYVRFRTVYVRFMYGLCTVMYGFERLVYGFVRFCTVLYGLCTVLYGFAIHEKFTCLNFCVVLGSLNCTNNLAPDSSRGMLNNAFLHAILHVQQHIHYGSWVAIIVRFGWCVYAHCYLSVFARPLYQLMHC